MILIRTTQSGHKASSTQQKYIYLICRKIVSIIKYDKLFIILNTVCWSKYTTSKSVFEQLLELQNEFRS